MVRLDRVETLVLQRVGAHLVGQSDAPPFLVEVEQDACPLLSHLRQRRIELRSAVAFQRAQQIAGETGGMKSREYRLGTVRAADLDGVMLVRAILGPEDVQPGVLRRAQRHLGRDHVIEPRQRQHVGACRVGLDDGQHLALRKAFGVLKRQDQGGGQQPRRFHEGDRQPVQPGVAAPAGGERALHRLGQVIRWIGDRLHPVEPRIARKDHPRQIAVIGPRLQRFGPARSNGQVKLSRQRPQHRQPRRRNRLGRDHQRAARPRLQHHRHPHAQVGAGTGEQFSEIGREGHGRLPVRAAASVADGTPGPAGPGRR